MIFFRKSNCWGGKAFPSEIETTTVSTGVPANFSVLAVAGLSDDEPGIFKSTRQFLKRSEIIEIGNLMGSCWSIFRLSFVLAD